jgi:hypothetical protein
MENLIKRTRLLNISELERACGFAKGRLAEVRRGRVKLTLEENHKIHEVLVNTIYPTKDARTNSTDTNGAP